METVTTTFVPAQHGFKFVNYFDLKEFTTISLPFISFAKISLGDVIYGLCGGMCFSALDYYHVPLPVPEVSIPDEIPLKLFLHLWDRQLVSLGQDTLGRLFQWMFTDDKTIGKAINQNEIPRLKELLKAGSPAVLVLVRTKFAQNPTNNHQVVAVGYDYDTDTKLMTIHLYDPNHPGDSPDLTMNLAKPAQGINLAQSTGEELRGFFVLDYQPEPVN